MSETVHSFTHEAMTTRFEVIVAGRKRDYAGQASGAVFREFDRIEGLLSKYNAGSDVGQINLLKAGESVRVGIETIECLEIAAWAHAASGGLFDPTLGTGFERLKVDRAAFTVGWSADGAGKLDLGGVGKGYSIDKAAEILKDWDVPEAVINGGTSTVLALGRAWELGVGGPWGEKAGFTTVTLQDQALSGSGTEVKGEHILNPKTGNPATRHLAAWAIHPSAAKSDALSTAFMMMTPENINQLRENHPEVTAYVVKQDETLIKIGV